MNIRIEDEFQDVIMKASTGLSIGKQELAEKAGISVDEVAGLLDGEVKEDALRKVAEPLGLHPKALVDMAKKAWRPEPIELQGLELYNTPFPVPGYEEMTVNSYLVWDKASRIAVAFDTGASAKDLLTDIGLHNLTLKALFLTHTHRDHIADYDTVVDACMNLATYAPAGEPHAKAMPVAHADRFHIGPFTVEARLTHGHSPGGMSYVVNGLGRHLAIVGDSLFCLSQGGAKEQYARALENNRSQILSLPDDTVLCPGHGPITTVAIEKARNPFFPEFK